MFSAGERIPGRFMMPTSGNRIGIHDQLPGCYRRPAAVQHDINIHVALPRSIDADFTARLDRMNIPYRTKHRGDADRICPA